MLFVFNKFLGQRYTWGIISGILGICVHDHRANDIHGELQVPGPGLVAQHCGEFEVNHIIPMLGYGDSGQ